VRTVSGGVHPCLGTVASLVRRYPPAGVGYLLDFSAIEMNPSHIGTSRGSSRTLPISGYPLGPGGYGGRLPLRFHLRARAKDAAAQSEAA